MPISVLKRFWPFSAKSDTGVLTDDQKALVRGYVREAPLQGNVRFFAALPEVVRIVQERPRLTSREINDAFAKACAVVAKGNPNRAPSRLGRDFVERVNAKMIAGERAYPVVWSDAQVGAANQLATRLMQARRQIGLNPKSR